MNGPPSSNFAVRTKSSGMAKAAFIFGLAGAVAWVVVVACSVAGHLAHLPRTDLPFTVVVGLATLLGAALNLAGLILGIIALAKGTSAKWMAFAGIVLIGSPMVCVTLGGIVAAMLNRAELIPSPKLSITGAGGPTQTPAPAVSSPNSPSALTMESVRTLPHDQVESRLPDSPGVIYYAYAGRLFKEGDKDDSVFWFYVGQLRFRIELAAHPNQDPSGAPALFASLNSELGGEINGYAGGDVKMWVAQIDRALAWDLANRNGVTSKTVFAKVYEEQRAGLKKLRDLLVAQAGQIRQSRAAHGLENRSTAAPGP